MRVIQVKLRSVLVCILILALVLTTKVAAAQGEDVDDGGETPRSFEHPVLAVFRAYFGDEVAEEVAIYRQGSADGESGEGGGVGFGVLVKMYAIAAESKEACADVEGPCGVTVEELMAARESGMGMGQLFKEYGKPSMLGVGHLKKASGDKGGPPDHAGPKDKDRDKGGPPAHAGPKDKDK